jgi:hypothetical protein
MPRGIGVSAAFARARRAIRGRPVLTRWLLAGPGAVILGLVTMCAMTIWLPAGAGGINNIAIPIILTPLLWAVPFFYATLEPNLERATAVFVAATLAQGLMLAISLA